MRLTIKLSVSGGEPIPSSETVPKGRGEEHQPKVADTRDATLKQTLERAAEFVERRAAELSTTEIQDPAWPSGTPAKPFGRVIVSTEIED